MQKCSSPINYEIEQKQSEFERNANKILAFERFLLKIRGIRQNCLFKIYNEDGFHDSEEILS